MNRPLSGLRVLDMSRILAGPWCGQALADLGAEVIKIERPGKGDDTRAWGPPFLKDRDGRDTAESAYYLCANRGKQSVTLDIARPEGQAVARELAQRADILLENYKVGDLKRYGLDYETLSALNPRLVYCSITGYGQDGPLRDSAGHDLNYIARTGLLALSMGTRDAPVVPPALIADIAAGAYPAVMNILLALRERDRTGTGRRLDVAMADNLFPFMYWALGTGAATGRWPGNGTDMVTGGTPRYRLYPAADGRMIAAAPIEQKFWETFCSIIGLGDEWRDDTRDPDGTTRAVAAIIAARGSDEWDRLFEGRDCCCCVVRGLDEALSDEHFRHRGLFAHGLRQGAASLPALPVPIDPGFRGEPRELGVPALGGGQPRLHAR